MKQHKLLDIRHLSESVYVLKLERKGLEFKAGQYIMLGNDNTDMREYSIYSGENDDYLEVLIKEVQDGWVSRQLKAKLPGVELDVDGPFGHFTIDPNILNDKILLIATGTGISPYHSFIKTYPNLNHKVLHGIRFLDEAYEKETFKKGKYIVCSKKCDYADFNGRVTDYVKLNPVKEKTHCFLCGNNKMIREMKVILKEQGISDEFIHTEIYY